MTKGVGMIRGLSVAKSCESLEETRALRRAPSEQFLEPHRE